MNPIHHLFPGDSVWETARFANTSSFEYEVSKDSPEKNVWLFNIENDPEERTDLSAAHPEKVRKLLERLAAYKKTAVAPQHAVAYLWSSPIINGGVFGPRQESTQVYM